MTTLPAGFPDEVVAEYSAAGYWGTDGVADFVARNADRDPDGIAWIEGDERLSWADYDEESTRLALGLVGAGLERGERVAVYLPDRPQVHTTFLGLEKAGCVAVGIGPRAGPAEVNHLLNVTGATSLITPVTSSHVDFAEMVNRLRAEIPHLERHLVVGEQPPKGARSLIELADEHISDDRSVLERRRLGPNEVFLLNSTSGTTGLPKCVKHTQNRWIYFSRLALMSGNLTADDVFMSVLPAPFGFGLWSAHFCPTLLGSSCVIMAQWDAERALASIESERVSIFSGVTTQLMMMLEAPGMDARDLSSLRVVYTGGEPVPYERAREFERRADCVVLQFYGSNESGALSYTSDSDPVDRRLRTAGKIIPTMAVRLFADDGSEIEIERGGRGQPACRGPLMSPGYHNDPVANAELVRSDGWLMMPDIVDVDVDGYLSVVGRVADIIIRGGVNVSAAEVEEAISAHPAVAMVGVVGMPDATFGERVCAYVVLRPGTSVTLEELRNHVTDLGMAKYQRPDRLEVVGEMPLSIGGKIAKAVLKRDIASKLESEQA